ncbi:MAG TPA: hypothetical protein VMT97_14525 [Terriglobales bacterium]|nr:hypothetical protein [Terriglobales bacterium]
MVFADGGRSLPPSAPFLAGGTWMSWRLIMLNVVLAVVCVALAAGIVRTLQTKRPMPEPVTSRASGGSKLPVPAEAGQSRGAEYAAIIARDLFNPSRGETIAVASSAAKPYLHGVVIDGTKSRAYLEDPLAKRVGGYSVGDEVAGGRIQGITSDRVVIARPEGMMEVLLQDPSKPRDLLTAAPAPVVTSVPAQIAPPPPGPPPSRAPAIPFQPRGRALGQGRPGNE